jgi:hypothetical protein
MQFAPQRGEHRFAKLRRMQSLGNKELNVVSGGNQIMRGGNRFVTGNGILTNYGDADSKGAVLRLRAPKSQGRHGGTSNPFFVDAALDERRA